MVVVFGFGFVAWFCEGLLSVLWLGRLCRHAGYDATVTAYNQTSKILTGQSRLIACIYGGPPLKSLS